jgi:hypothetical protein
MTGLESKNLFVEGNFYVVWIIISGRWVISHDVAMGLSHAKFSLVWCAENA